MAEEFIIKILGTDFATGVSTATSKKASSGGVGAVADISTKIAGMFSLVKNILDVVGPVIDGLLKPIKGILTNLFKMIGELLRPIVDVIMILLQPILTMIKPFISTFRTLMAPFIDIARQMGGVSQQLMAQGETGAAMDVAIQAMGVIIGPFAVAFSSVLIDFLQTSLFGALSALATIMIQGIGNMFQPIADFFGKGDEWEANITAISLMVEQGFQTASDTVSGLISGLTDNILGAMLEQAQSNLDEIKDKYGNILQDNVVLPVLESLNDAKGDVKVTGDDVAAVFTDTMGEIHTDVESKMDSDGTIPTTYISGLNEMVNATSWFKDKLVSYGGQIREAFDRARENIEDEKESFWDSLIPDQIQIGPAIYDT